MSGSPEVKLEVIENPEINNLHSKMIKWVTILIILEIVLIIFGKMHFLLMSENNKFLGIPAI